MKMTKTEISARLAVALPADTPAATVKIVAKLMREASAPAVVVEKTVPLYRAMAQALDRLAQPEPHYMRGLHHQVREYIKYLCTMHMPHGSGFDSGVTFDEDRYDADVAARRHLRLVFDAPYHMMTEYGCYCGWVEFTFEVKATFDGIHTKLIGTPSREGGGASTKGYVHDTLYSSVTSEVEPFWSWRQREGYAATPPAQRPATQVAAITGESA